jgi:hypothetical protein
MQQNGIRAERVLDVYHKSVYNIKFYKSNRII